MSGAKRRVRLYELYPGGRSGLSTQTKDYHGEWYKVAAVSIRQAYWLVGNRQWAAGPDEPVGVVEHYTKYGPPEGWHRLWDGCRIHGGLGLDHGASRTAIAEAMRAHLAKHAELEDGGQR